MNIGAYQSNGMDIGGYQSSAVAAGGASSSASPFVVMRIKKLLNKKKRR